MKRKEGSASQTHLKTLHRKRTEKVEADGGDNRAVPNLMRGAKTIECARPASLGEMLGVN